jgi:hypothetical protein
MQDLGGEPPRTPVPRTRVHRGVGGTPGPHAAPIVACAKVGNMDYGGEALGPEKRLPGTFSTLAKVGETVRRSTGPWTPAVHALLRYLERVGFDGAVRGRPAAAVLPRGRLGVLASPGRRVVRWGRSRLGERRLPQRPRA